MAVKKGEFERYIKSRETPALSKILSSGKKYTHNRVFDTLDRVDDSETKESNLNSNYSSNIRSPATNMDVERKEYKKETSTDKKSIENKSQPVSNTDNTHKISIMEVGTSSTTISKICGAQRKILLALFNNCRLIGSMITQELNIEHIMSITGLTKNTIKTSIMRLKKKGAIYLAEYKDGRAGWSKYGIPKVMFNEILHSNNALNGITINAEQYNNVQREPEEKLHKNNRVDSVDKLPQDWLNINVSPLSDIGFSGTQIKQIYSNALNTPEVVQDSINHFSFGLLNNPKIKQYHDPLNVLMGVLRKGQAWIEPNYESPKEKAQRELLERKKNERERIKKLEEEAYNIAFTDWKEELSPELMESLSSQIDKGGIMPDEVKWKMYFKKNIWPNKKNDYLICDTPG